MSNVGSNINLDLTGDALEILQSIQSNFDILNKKVIDIEVQSKKSFDGIKKSLQQISLVSITQSFENFKNTLTSLNAPGLEFESQMAELEAITGIAGDQLDYLGTKARENAKIFGGDAAGSVEVYKLLLSQLTPELANQPEVLGAMADSVSVLSKTMSGDTSGAVEVLTTAMNQYGISFDDPLKAQAELNRMMNIMAAGAKEGSAELPALKAAIENVGGPAKSANVQFQEMVSSIELLDKAGKKGSEGGIALRNVIASLNQGRFLPKDVQQELQGAGIDIESLSDKSLKFTDRLRLLNPIVNDAALLSKLFGKENQLAGEALIRSTDEQDRMTAAIINTNTATDQANIIMDTQAEKLNRTNAWFTDLKITMSEYTSALGPILETTMSGLEGLSTIVPGLFGISRAFNAIRKSQIALNIVQKATAIWTGIVTAATTALGVAVNLGIWPITLIVGALAGLVASVVWVTNNFEKFKGWFVGLWNWLTDWFSTIVKFWANYLNPFGWLINLVDYFFPGVKSKIVNWFGDLFKGIYDIFVKPLTAAWDWITGLFDWFGSDENGFTGEVTHTVVKKAGFGGGQSDGGGAGGTWGDATKGGLNATATPRGGNGSGGSQGSKGAGFASAEKKEINTRIENLVKNLTIQVPEVNMSTGKIKAMISEALTGAVLDFEVALD